MKAMLKIYNTLSGKKEIFQPLKQKRVNLFVCGPTVYDSAHLGHARTYLAFDTIAKYLKENGYAVFYLQNVTDIDDKIIQRAKEKATAPNELAKQYEKEYLQDMKALKIDSVQKYARATDHVKQIIDQVQRLLKKGFAYQIRDGIYYDIAKFKNYGKLSQRTVLQAEDAVSRIDESREKRNRGDFCLWKFSKPDEPQWPSPWGQGRPGWHIEDTAIAEKFFGTQYDMHGGARDLIFPHHEAEIAQMEALSGKRPMVRYWLHSGFLSVWGQKMAKSLGNFITVRDFLKKDSARTLRFLIIKNHYRSPIDYNENAVSQAKKELARIDEFIDKLKTVRQKRTNAGLEITKFRRDFASAMEDDFNTPKAVATIFGLISKGNGLIAQNKLSLVEAKDILQFLKKVDKIFNFIFEGKPRGKIPREILDLAEEREECRKSGNWRKADEIRNEIKKMGWRVEDSKDGPEIKKSEL